MSINLRHKEILNILEKNGAVYFPDAPTLRGVKHLQGLTRCIDEGYSAMALFIIQMENTKVIYINY